MPIERSAAASPHSRTYDRPTSIPQIDASVVRRVSQLLDDAVALADRGAVFSARAQLIKGIRLVSQSLDAEARTQHFSQSLANGLQALDEAKDFAPNGSELEAHLNMRQIVDAHRTQILKNKSVPTPLAALQMYHAFAEEQLAAACGREEIAARILVALAKLQPLLVSQDSDISALAIPRSMSLYQAALIIDSNNYLAANELGVLFGRYGQLEDARDVLAHCAEIDPNQAVAWKNLAAVHRQLGEHQLAAAATEEWNLASGAGRGRIPTNPQAPAVEWVNPDAFSAGQVANGGPTTTTNPMASTSPTRSQPDPPTIPKGRSIFKRNPDPVSKQAKSNTESGKTLPELPSSQSTPTSWSERFTSLMKINDDRTTNRR
jgi:hypothetical protein